MTTHRRRSSKKDSSSTHGPRVDPPRFSLPPDFETNRSRYELWSIRVPVKFDMSSLNDMDLPPTLNLSKAQGKGGEGSGSSSGGGGPLIEFPIDGKRHALTEGHRVESDSFRILVTDKTDEEKNEIHFDSSDDDSDDDSHKGSGSGKKMRPLPTPFDRHINVIEMAPEDEMKDTVLAPSSERAPPAEDEELKIAYAPVAQVDGLKRRWRPIGGGADPPPPPARKKRRVVVVAGAQSEGHRGGERARVEKEGAERDALAGPPNVEEKGEDRTMDKKAAKKARKEEKAAQKAARRAEKAAKKAAKKAKKDKKRKRAES